MKLIALLMLLTLVSIDAEVICLNECYFLNEIHGCDDTVCDVYPIPQACIDNGCAGKLSDNNYCDDRGIHNRARCPFGHDCADCGERGDKCYVAPILEHGFLATEIPYYGSYHGNFEEGVYYHKFVGEMACDEGYSPMGDVAVMCYDGSWIQDDSLVCVPATQTSIEEVECSTNGVTVTVAADGIPVGMLLGGDINCAGTEITDNGVLYYRYTTSGYESCGLTIVNTTDDYIVYHTFLGVGDTSVVDIYCNMEKRGEVSINVTANPCIITASLEGFGTFKFFGSVYEDDSFDTLHDPDVPVDMCDGSDIYFGIRVEYDGGDIEMFVDYCYVIEDPDDDASPKYYLINNGCPNVGYNVVPYADNPLEKKYSFSAYEFVYTNGMPMLYIRCGAVICDLGDANSLCAQGCFSGRMKRGEHTSESTIITQGPYALQGCPD